MRPRHTHRRTGRIVRRAAEAPSWEARRSLALAAELGRIARDMAALALAARRGTLADHELATEVDALVVRLREWS